MTRWYAALCSPMTSRVRTSAPVKPAKASAAATKLELESANSSLAKEKVAIEEQLEATVLEKEALSNQVSTQAEEQTQLEEQCITLKKSEATLQKENSTLTVEKEALSKQVEKHETMLVLSAMAGLVVTLFLVLVLCPAVGTALSILARTAVCFYVLGRLIGCCLGSSRKSKIF